jgi:hypothetical protein
MAQATKAGKKRRPCPSCLSRNTRRSRRNLLEYPLLVFFIRPYRCRHCLTRFWRFG